MVLGTGYRGTLEQLDAEARERVRRDCLHFVEANQVRSVETNVVYALANKPAPDFNRSVRVVRDPSPLDAGWVRRWKVVAAFLEQSNDLRFADPDFLAANRAAWNLVVEGLDSGVPKVGPGLGLAVDLSVISHGVDHFSLVEDLRRDINAAT